MGVLGLTYMGKPCKRGHSGPRYARSRTCVECKRAATAKWRAENPGKHQASNAKWARENPEKGRACAAKWRAENPEKVRAKDAKWRRENPEKVRAVGHRRRARKAAATVAPVPPALLRYAGWPCYLCGAPAAAIDHVHPLARGGAHAPDNLEPICWGCNSSKGARTLLEWAAGRSAGSEPHPALVVLGA